MFDGFAAFDDNSFDVWWSTPERGDTDDELVPLLVAVELLLAEMRASKHSAIKRDFLQYIHSYKCRISTWLKCIY